MRTQRRFDQLSERLECTLSKWWGASLYFGTTAFVALPWGWDGIDKFIFTTNSVILVLVLGCNRRDTKALLTQNEKLLERLGVDTDLARLEEKTEAEIEELRA